MLSIGYNTNIRGWVVDKQKLETSYYDRMYENCHIPASMAPRHLRTGRERACTIIYQKADFFKAEAITLAMIWLEIVKKSYNDFVTTFIEAHCHTKRIQ